MKIFPALGLLGPRQVGKTTLAKAIALDFPKAEFLDLERAQDLKLLADPIRYLEPLADRLVILDEIQRVPELFPALRVLIDQERRPGRFLILGSASPALLKQSSESLAGRLEYWVLGPLNLAELQPLKRDWQDLWVRGGYPASYLAADANASLAWREAYLATHLERDFPNLGFRSSTSNLRRFWQMLAHLQGQIWNAAQVAQSLGVDRKTALHYLDMLEDTYMARRLQPFLPNLGKRLAKAPKVYLRDTGLLHALLQIEDLKTLLGHPVAGPSFEGLVIEQIVAQMPRRWRYSFYRTHSGAEMDLVIETSGAKPPIGVEIKLSSAPSLGRGFWQAKTDIKAEKAYVIAPVDRPYSLGKGVTVLPLDRIHEIEA